MSKIFDNDDFGYRRITVERLLRLNFRLARLENLPQNMRESIAAFRAQEKI